MLSNHFVVTNIKSKAKTKATLITALCDETLSLLTSFHMPNDIADKTSKYESLIKILDIHFTTVRSYFSAHGIFYEARKLVSENVNEWAARIQLLALPCGFDTELDIILRDKFVLGLD